MVDASSPRSHELEHAARSDYLAPLPRSDAPREFDRAIKLLCPPGDRAALVQLFDGRAQRDTIRDWRRGRRGIPQWAKDLLRAKLRPYVDSWQAIDAIAPGPGKDWRRTKSR